MKRKARKVLAQPIFSQVEPKKGLLVAKGAASSSNRALYDSSVLAPKKSIVLVVTADSPRVSALQTDG
jgi:hypothetical protein